MKRHIWKALSFEPIRFLVIGSVNTVIDFAILNTLVSGFGYERIKANVASTTVAMAFSFWANRRLVFRSDSHSHHREALLFITGTLFGLYVIQNAIIYWLTTIWTDPLLSAADFLSFIDKDLVITNGAKAVATVATMFWNFFFYKHVVFAKQTKRKKEAKKAAKQAEKDMKPENATQADEASSIKEAKDSKKEAADKAVEATSPVKNASARRKKQSKVAQREKSD